MMGNNSQNLPVEAFGFVQLPGLMASGRINEHLLNARRHSLKSPVRFNFLSARRCLRFMSYQSVPQSTDHPSTLTA